MKKQLPGLLLAMLLTLSLAACGEVQGAGGASVPGYSGGSGSLIDLPVEGPEDSSLSDSRIPDDGSPDSSHPDESQGMADGADNSDGSGSQDLGNTVEEDGWYSSKEEVALYLYLYDHLPGNYVTKREAEAAGWTGGNVERYTGEGTAIGGSTFGNREGLLPKAQGRTYTECDIGTVGGNSRGAERIVFSNDGLIYYTGDHYESFELLYGEP